MRLPSLAIVMLVAALLAAPAAAYADDSPGSRFERPLLGSALESCSVSALPAERVAIFTGAMPALPGADRMSMRFDLERLRPGGKRWRRIVAPTFGVWERSQPDRAGFVFRKRVDGLAVPARYRVLLRFRWEDADGEIVRSARHRTAACEQPDLRPDLVVETVTAILDAPGLAVYRVKVRNAGRSTAGAFTVRLGSASVEVPQLAAARRTTVLVLAAECAFGEPLLVRVDADGRVDEADERANLLRGVCPVLSG